MNIRAPRKGFVRELAVFVTACLMATALFVGIFRFALTLNIIPSGSMIGTLDIGDIVIGTRWDRKSISRYDIVTFRPPDNEKTLYIKRVIGLPGELIVVNEGEVYANGKKLDQSFINKGEQNTAGDGVYRVPEGCYFMLGDNRDFSEDSRYWTKRYVPAENIVCHARWTVFPLGNAKSLKYRKK